MSIKAYIMTILILVIVVIVLCGVVAFLTIMLHQLSKEIADYHTPVFVPEIDWVGKEADDGSQRIPKTEV